MTSKRLWYAVLGMMLAGSACERSISVGAAGRHTDGGGDGVPIIGGGAPDGDASIDGDASMAGAAELCTSTGGTVTTANCCANGVASFPDTCIIGACGCAPASSVTIMICSCAAGCFSPGVGCVAKASAGR
jgi:hypothetical protein